MLSGNIQDYIKQNPHQGIILESEDELHEFIRNGELGNRIAEYQVHGKPQAELVWM